MSATKIQYPGRWAVVTGASSGLGRGLAARLAEGTCRLRPACPRCSITSATVRSRCWSTTPGSGATGRLRHPEPVIEAGLRALDRGHAVVIPGVRNKIIAASGRFMPREWLTLVSAQLLRPAHASRPPIEVHNEIVIQAPAERVWDLLTDVERWPSWYRACRWVRVESTGGAAATGSGSGPSEIQVSVSE